MSLSKKININIQKPNKIIRLLSKVKIDEFNANLNSFDRANILSKVLLIDENIKVLKQCYEITSKFSFKEKYCLKHPLQVIIFLI